VNNLQARKRIKEHLAKRGDQPVVITRKMVRYWWRLLNLAVFDSTLPSPIRIDIVYMRDVHGWAIPYTTGRMGLTLVPKFLSRRMFLSTLVHEMVHAWEHNNKLHMGHGSAFYGWAPQIKRTTSLILERKI
jgi:hypothetical protein